MPRLYFVVKMLLLAALVGLTPLAYASPPDPTYISGLWDNGDYDDVVVLTASASFVFDVQARPSPTLVPLNVVTPASGVLRVAAPPLCLLSRAPPAA